MRSAFSFVRISFPGKMFGVFQETRFDRVISLKMMKSLKDVLSFVPSKLTFLPPEPIMNYIYILHLHICLHRSRTCITINYCSHKKKKWGAWWSSTHPETSGFCEFAFKSACFSPSQATMRLSTFTLSTSEEGFSWKAGEWQIFRMYNFHWKLVYIIYVYIYIVLYILKKSNTPVILRILRLQVSKGHLFEGNNIYIYIFVPYASPSTGLPTGYQILTRQLS